MKKSSHIAFLVLPLCTNVLLVASLDQNLNPPYIIDNDIIGAYRVMAGKSISDKLLKDVKLLSHKYSWSLHELALNFASRKDVRDHLGINWLPAPTHTDHEFNLQETEEITTNQVLTSSNYTDEEIIGAYRVMAGCCITPGEFGLCQKYRTILPRFLLILDETIKNLNIPPLHMIETFAIPLPSLFTIFGYKSDKFIAQALAEHGFWEPYMETVMRKIIKQGDTVLDVGANIGYFTAVFAKCVGENGRVLAFEPLPPLVTLLEKFKAFNQLRNVEIYPYALSNEEDNIYIKINPISPGVSHSVTPEMVEHYESKMPGFINKVKAIPFDVLFKDLKTKIDLIKIDVEGMEDLVLAGIDAHIRKYHPLVIWELNPHLYKKRNVSVKDLLHYYENLGYSFGIVKDLIESSNPIQAVHEHPLSTEQVLGYLEANNIHQIDIILC